MLLVATWNLVISRLADSEVTVGVILCVQVDVEAKKKTTTCGYGEYLGLLPVQTRYLED